MSNYYLSIYKTGGPRKLVQTEFLVIRFPAKVKKAMGLLDKEVIKFKLNGDKLELSYIGQMSGSISRTSNMGRLRTYTLGISFTRIKDLELYEFPTKTTKIGFEIINDQLYLDFAPFKKAKKVSKGFSSLALTNEAEKPKTGFSLLRTLNK